MGKGSFVVGGEDYEGNINRNIASFQVITRDKSLGGFDVSVNVDHRLFTKEGRQEWKAEKKQEVENFKNLGRNVKRAGKNVKNATDDLSIAVSENLKGEGNGIFEDYERKTEGTEMALQMAIKQEEITNIISNPEEHSQEELQGAITALVGSTSGAEVNFYEGDELTDDQRMTVDGEDKSALPGFYDAEGNTIYLNADKTNSISDLLTVTRHENQHAIDDQDGVDYTTYSQDKDHYEDLAKKSESEFMHSLEREFGDNPNKESTSAFTDMDAGSNGAGGVEQVMPFQFGKRALGNASYPVEWVLNPYDDKNNYELVHEQGFYEDRKGDNIGFGSGGKMTKENVEDYVFDGIHYDDDIMRKAVNEVEFGNYSNWPWDKNNCQDYSDRLRDKYKEILKRMGK